MSAKNRVGPWLRSYQRDDGTIKEERRELAIGVGVGVVGLALLIGLIWLFVRWPYPVLGILAGTWVVGFVVFLVRSRRARMRDQMIGAGHVFHEVRRAIREVERREGAGEPGGEETKPDAGP